MREKQQLIDVLKQYHDNRFTPHVYEHSIFGKAALLLERSEEVVRCKECLNYQETVGKDSGKPCGYGSCRNPCAMTGIVYDEDFCSYGERRTDA